ncbi:NACHT, LRR and PYD domains-containing protein 3-like [Saccoglossus kowalevskii]
MATAPILSDWVYCNKTLNGARLSALLLNEGTHVIRRYFDSQFPPSTLQKILNNTKNTKTFNYLLKKTKVLNQRQYDLLYPPTGAIPSSANFDITLLILLIRNLCGLHPPNWSGWNQTPQPNDKSLVADLIRLKQFRNELYGHIVTTEISDAQFTQYWSDISDVLIRLGSKQSDIEKYKIQSLDPMARVEALIRLIELCREDLYFYEHAIIGKYEDMEKNLISKIEDKRHEIDAGEKFAEELRIHYKDKMNWMEPVPWCEDGFQLQLQDVYTQLEFSERNEQGVEIKGVDFQQCLSQDNPTHRILVEGQPGGGKSTLLRKLALDWANGTKPMLRYDLVVLLELRQITKPGTITDLIFDQLLPEDSNIGKQNLHNYLTKHQHNVLILLDGADELNESFNSYIMKIVEGKILRDSTVIITSRSTSRGQLIPHVQKKVIIKGFSNKNINLYIQRFFNNNELWKDIEERDIESFASNPLNLALICVLYKDCKGMLPTKLSELYYLLIICAYKRYCLKNNICNPSDISIKDCPEFINLILRLGEMAYNGIKEDKFRFEKDILKHHNISDSDLSVGLLNQEYSTARIQYQQIYVFQHKTFQEFLAAYYLHTYMNTIGNECIDSVIKSTAFCTVCEFLAGLLGRDGVLFLYRVIHNIKSVTNIYSDLYDRLLCLAFISLHELQTNQLVAEVAQAIVHNNILHITCLPSADRYNAAFSSGLTSVIKYCNKSSITLESVEVMYLHSNFSEFLNELLGCKHLQSIDLTVDGSDIHKIVLFLRNKSLIHACIFSMTESHDDVLSICDLLSNPDVNTPSLSLFVTVKSMHKIPHNIRLRNSLHSLFLWADNFGLTHKLLTQIQGGIDCPYLTSLGVIVDDEISDDICYMMANILTNNTCINKLFFDNSIVSCPKADKALCKALQESLYLSIKNMVKVKQI